jgi:hypothetical protein
MSKGKLDVRFLSGKLDSDSVPMAATPFELALCVCSVSKEMYTHTPEICGTYVQLVAYLGSVAVRQVQRNTRKPASSTYISKGGNSLGSRS